MAEAVELLTNIMQVDLNNLRSISNNLANINTTAYKSEATANTAFYPHLDINATQALQDGSRLPSIYSDVIRQYQQGAVKATGNDHHLALDGDGFLLVKDLDNEYYTRRGELIVNNSGLLALVSGELVQGKSGDIFVGSDAFKISSKGEIMQKGSVVDRLSIMLPSSLDQLEYVGNGLAKSNSTNNELQPADNYTVLQGFLEASNVDTTKEVVNMIETLRHFEASGKVLQAYDRAIGHTITELGRF